MSRKLFAGIATSAVLGFAAVAFAAVPNGNFESGDFSGWSVVDDGNAARSISTGNWQVYKGRLKFEESPPPRGDEEAPESLARPPQGDFAAGLSTLDPGSHILHRVLDPNGKSVLSMQLAYKNTADDFFVKNSLSETPPRGLGGGDYRNQQLRVDLLKPGAPVDTLDKDHIIDTLLRTKPGDKLNRAYSTLKADVGGGAFRLRIAEVDNQAPFLVGVDAVKLESD